MALLVLLALLSAPAARDRLPYVKARVDRVKDGDTFEARLERTNRGGGPAIQHATVRIHGIDAPERGQAYGEQAKAALAALVDGRDVELLETDRDREGRLVAVVMLEGRDVGAVLIRSGHAWAFREYLGGVEGDDDYCALEYEARAARRGLWAGAHPRAPWLEREARRGKRAARSFDESSAFDCVGHFRGASGHK